MAEYGSIPTAVINGCALRIGWRLTGQSVANNCSYLYWSTTGDGSGHIGTTQSYINGVLLNTGGNIDIAPGTLVGEGNVTVYHAADGTGTVGCAIRSSTGGSPLNIDGSWALPTIARKPYLTDATDFTDTGNPVIKYKNPVGSAVQTLQACISLSGSRDDVPYRDVPKTGESYTFNLTETERNTLRSAATGTAMTVYFYLRSTVGGVTEHSVLQRTMTVSTETAKPTASCTVAINNTGLPSAFDGIAIQGLSRLNVAVTGTAKYGASIVLTRAYVGADRYDGPTFTSGLLANIGDVEVVPYAYDSRGAVSDPPSPVTKVYVWPYQLPRPEPITGQSGLVCYRSNSGGSPSAGGTNITVKAKKSCSTLGGLNGCVLRVRVRSQGGSWGSWQTLLDFGSASAEYSGVINGSYAVNTVYETQLSCVDGVGSETTVSFLIPTEGVTLDLGSGGKAVGIGRYADTAAPESFKVAWNSWFDQNVNVAGFVNCGGIALTGNQSVTGWLSVNGSLAAGSLTVGGSALADWIVEQGSAGADWKYRKYQSGRLEMDGYLEYANIQVTSAMNALFVSGEKQVTFPSGLVKSGTVPFTGFTVFYADSPLLQPIVYGVASQSGSIRFRFASPISATVNIALICRVTGQWK